MFCSITLLSPALAPGAALLCIANRFPQWIDQLMFYQQPEHTRHKLLEQFDEAEKSTVEILRKRLESCKADPKKKDVSELAEKLLGIDTRYGNVSNPANLHLKAEDACCLIRETEELHKQYRLDDKLIFIKTLYSGLFFETIADKEYELLAKWLEFTYELQANGIFDSIVKELLSFNHAEVLIAGNVALKKNSKVRRNKGKNTERFRSAFIAIQHILVSILCALTASGIVFTVFSCFGTELEPIFLIAIPLSLFLCELLLYFYTAPPDSHREMRWVLSPKWLECVVSIVLRALLSGTCVYLVSKLYGKSTGGAWLHWALAFLLAGVTERMLEQYRYWRRRCSVVS